MKTETRIALITFAHMSSWIVVPVVGGLFLGRYIDRVLVTAPYGILISLAICFFISIVGIIHEAKKATHDMKKF